MIRNQNFKHVYLKNTLLNLVDRFDINPSISLPTWQSDWYFFSFFSFLVVSRFVQNFCHYRTTQDFFSISFSFYPQKTHVKKGTFLQKKKFTVRHFIIFLDKKKFPTWCHSHFFSDESAFFLFHMYHLGLGLSSTSKNFSTEPTSRNMDISFFLFDQLN